MKQLRLGNIDDVALLFARHKVNCPELLAHITRHLGAKQTEHEAVYRQFYSKIDVLEKKLEQYKGTSVSKEREAKNKVTWALNQNILGGKNASIYYREKILSLSKEIEHLKEQLKTNNGRILPI